MSLIGTLLKGAFYTSDGVRNYQVKPTRQGSSPIVNNDGNLVFDGSDTSDVVQIKDDFIYFSGTNPGELPWNFQSRDGASALAIASTATHPGIIQLSTGNGAASEAALLRGKSDGGAIENFVLGGGSFSVETIINLTDLSTVSEEYDFYFGLADGLGNFVTHPGNNFVGFQYSRLTSVNWLALTKSGGTTTTASGGASVPVATGWLKLRFEINAAATSVEFFVNDISLGVSLSNIPTAPISLGWEIKKSAGTTSVNAQIDYVNLVNQLTVSRFA